MDAMAKERAITSRWSSMQGSSRFVARACALALCALAAAAAPARAAAAPVPLIVDTDMFSNADDIGALATAFGLQLKGEANVIAVTVNKPTTRSAVATDSWRCVGAITDFYGSGSVP